MRKILGINTTRLFAISAALIVVALVGAALLNKKMIAPTITADANRRHSERGTCANCHTIVPAAKARQLDTASSRPAPPLRGIGATRPVAPQPAKQIAVAPTCAPCVTAAVSPQPSPVRQNATIAVVARQPGIAPPIVQGTLAPHDWRGQCSACHTLIKAGAHGDPTASLPAHGTANAVARASTAWTPTPPLDQQAQAAHVAREAEALGMSVRATHGEIKGMMVIEVEGLARRAGIQLGDIVRAVDGRVTTSVNTFLAASGTADPARGVVIDAARDGTNQVLILR